MKLNEIDTWIHIFHLRRASTLDWSIERTTNPKWHSHQDKMTQAPDLRIWTRPVGKNHPTNSIELLTKCLSLYQNGNRKLLFYFNHILTPSLRKERKFSSEVVTEYKYSCIIICFKSTAKSTYIIFVWQFGITDKMYSL